MKGLDYQERLSRAPSYRNGVADIRMSSVLVPHYVDSVFTAPLSGAVVWLWSHFVPMTAESPSTICIFSHFNSFSLIHLLLFTRELLNREDY